MLALSIIDMLLAVYFVKGYVLTKLSVQHRNAWLMAAFTDLNWLK